MNSIYLVGFMGSGKSTVGKALAQQLKREFIDTDDQIELKANKEIKLIFAEEGEAAFRKIEHDVLTETPKTGYVIATGGGIIERDENREWLSEKQVVYLKTSWTTIESRLKNDQSRPIWQDQTRDKQQLLKERDHKYREIATIIIETDEYPIDGIIEQIQAELV